MDAEGENLVADARQITRQTIDGAKKKTDLVRLAKRLRAFCEYFCIFTPSQSLKANKSDLEKFCVDTLLKGACSS